jgi:hypothetical protein
MIKVSGVSKVLSEISTARKSMNGSEKRRILEHTVKALAATTPVDTGRARDGWNVTNRGIENPVPYVSELNEGSSQQAPAYFIEKAVLATPGILPNGIIVTKLESEPGD